MIPTSHASSNEFVSFHSGAITLYVKGIIVTTLIPNGIAMWLSSPVSVMMRLA